LRIEPLENRSLLTLLGQPLFPADNPWNQRIDQAPVAANSAAIMSSIVGTYGNGRLHPDFGQDYRDSSSLYGIPYNVVHGNSNPKVHVVIDAYADQSDLENAPVPAGAVLEGDLQNAATVGVDNRGDSHLIVWDEDNNVAYEFYRASRPSENADGHWHADAEAVWDMKSNSFRTLGWTSADAAGLAILPGLVRPDEGLPTSQGGQGIINHAIRFTLKNSVILDQFLYPASHVANPRNDNPSVEPPMGARFRLKASVDITTLNPESRVIAQAMKNYGMIVADNGSNFFFSGASASVDGNNQFALTWNDGDIQDTSHGLKSLHYSDFEVVDLTPIVAGLSTASGAAGSQLTVTGKNFSGAAGHLNVLFGDKPAISLTVVDDSHIVVTAPAGSGTVDVTVQSGVNDPNDPSNIKSPVFGYGISATSVADKFSYSSPLIVSPATWTPAGLTLSLDIQDNLHVYVTGTTTDAVASRALSSVTSIQITAPSNGTASLTVDSSHGSPIPAGGLEYGGGGSLIKAGVGSVRLWVSNSYTGSTTVSAGTLKIGSAQTIPDGGDLTIGAGGALFFEPSSSATTSTPLTASQPARLAVDPRTRLPRGTGCADRLARPAAGRTIGLQLASRFAAILSRLEQTPYSARGTGDLGDRGKEPSLIKALMAEREAT
jgi:autotransporter-associated beta strand protein